MCCVFTLQLKRSVIKFLKINSNWNYLLSLETLTN